MADQSNSDFGALNATTSATTSIPTKIEQDDLVSRIVSAKTTWSSSDNKIMQSLDDIVQHHIVEASRNADEAVARIRALKKYCRDDCKRISTGVIKSLFNLADREVIVNLLMGNEG